MIVVIGAKNFELEMLTTFDSISTRRLCHNDTTNTIRYLPQRVEAIQYALLQYEHVIRRRGLLSLSHENAVDLHSESRAP